MRQADFDIAQSKWDGLTPEDFEPKLTTEQVEAEKDRRCKLTGDVSDAAVGLYKVDELDKEIPILADDDIRLLAVLRDKILRRLNDKEIDDYEEYRDRDY
jgi:uncharacterized small protein (DUF1192 family)